VNHAVVLPVLLPAACAVLMLLAGERRPGLQRALAVISTAALAVLAVAALAHTSLGAIEVYRLGDWPAPFGIPLVLDRLAALMLALTAVVALATLVAAMTGSEPWDRRGRSFHSFFQFQLMGLNGAFLTGDLFNLFVFFEVLLVASYCLLAHGSGAERLRASFHYVAVNLAASALFLLAIAALYAATGTLNLADLALRVPRVAPGDVLMVRAAALLLLAVFAVKAAVFPLYLWLPRAYAAAPAPVAALFAIMTKVGVYAIVRVHGLVFGPDAGPAAFVAGPWLLSGAVATAVLGVLGAYAAASLARMVAYLTVASVGTLLIGVALFSSASLGAALYYLVHSTLVVAALFLLVERIAVQRGGDQLAPAPPVAQPAVLGGVLVVAAMSIAGLPPLSGFVAKLALLEATGGLPATPLLWAVLLGVGLLATVAFARAGSTVFWKTSVGPPPAPDAGAAVTGAGPAASRAGVIALAPIAALLACGLALAVFAAPVKRYTDAAARQLADWRLYAPRVLHESGPQTTRPFPQERR
jgi:multicomponent K+:H+ antiporter subunit D